MGLGLGLGPGFGSLSESRVLRRTDATRPSLLESVVSCRSSRIVCVGHDEFDLSRSVR